MVYRKLNYSDFSKDLMIKNNVNLPGILMCYQNYCIHCKTLKPILKDLSADKNIVVYMVECSKTNFKVLSMFSIEYVPNIRYVSPKGKVYKTPYKGNLTKRDIKKFILSKIKK